MESSALLKLMLNPETYPIRPDNISMLQTHISFLFIAGEYVYKVKKPVTFGFIDYSTLEKRKFYCGQEIKLNSRLSPEIYLGISHITSDKDALSLDGKGEIEEYAVRMMRLPDDRMMDRMLLNKKINRTIIREIADKIVRFHKAADVNDEICRFGDVETILKNVNENFLQTEKYIGISLSREEYNFIKDFSLKFIEGNKALFKKRINEKRIRDCHGDLRAEHICLSDKIYPHTYSHRLPIPIQDGSTSTGIGVGVYIFDCIEFNDRFRYGDVASEVAFLAMDLDFFEEKELSKYFVDTYIELSGDRDINTLVGFYKCYRAYIRGKVESFKYDEREVSSEEREYSLNLAKRHFKLAFSYARIK